MTTGVVLTMYFGGIAFVGLLALALSRFDQLAVAALHRAGIPAFPLAMNLAALIYRRPDDWQSTEYRLSHPKVGDIWIASGARHVTIESNSGKWEPCRIEQRIIWEAVQWRTREYVQRRLLSALQMLPP